MAEVAAVVCSVSMRSLARLSELEFWEYSLWCSDTRHLSPYALNMDKEIDGPREGLYALVAGRVAARSKMLMEWCRCLQSGNDARSGLGMHGYDGN